MGVYGINGRIKRAEEEGGADEERVNGGVKQPLFQAIPVGVDVWEFRHGDFVGVA